MDLAAVRRAIWDGSIPCRIDLDPSECRVLDHSEPYFISIPRISYIPLHMPAIYRFFKPNLIEIDSSKLENAWLEFETVPLKWHWPTGVLYDHVTARDPSTTRAPFDEDDDHRLPWNLTLHFQNYPTKLLMRLDVPSACRDAWVNTAKEADHVRNGNAKMFLSLSKGESTTLWDSLSTHTFDKFWPIHDKLINPTSNPIRYIPLRIYIPTSSRVIQEPVAPYTSGTEKEPQRLGVVLRQILPELFKTSRVPHFARPVVHGVIVPMSTPVIELMHAAVYPDGFLHITLAMMV